MGKKTEQLYDDETMRLMSEAYEAAAKKAGTSDKALQVTMAVAIIRAINDGERDPQRLAAEALASVRGEAQEKPDEKPKSSSNTKPLRPGWVDLTAMLR